ncbi:50S ribosomal protein L16 [Candidatus Woesearchaeota archaeon]|nr:50S ribosomal protein L16 [Candidatus Woesearchaeota archaeon]
MAKLRSASAYRRIKRAFTRTSKVRSKSYIKGAPGKRIIRYDMGNLRKKFPFEISLISKRKQQIRDNAIEAARMASVRYLNLKVGMEHYHLKIKAVPHHILRENPLATGAGADRFQTGMSKSFGKAIGHAAQVNKGKKIITVSLDEKNIQHAKEACRKAKSKLGLPCSIEVKEKATGKIIK